MQEGKGKCVRRLENMKIGLGREEFAEQKVGGII